jgi:hypothetical protein
LFFLDIALVKQNAAVAAKIARDLSGLVRISAYIISEQLIRDLALTNCNTLNFRNPDPRQGHTPHQPEILTATPNIKHPRQLMGL